MGKTTTSNRIIRLSAKALEKKCEDVWKDCCYLGAGYLCEYPGCNRTIETGVLQVHHFFSRSHKSTRYWVPNGIVLCAQHHRLSPQAAHNDPLFRDVIEKVKPDGWLDALIERRNLIVKYNAEFLLWNLEYLNAVYNRLLDVKGVTQLHVKAQAKKKHPARTSACQTWDEEKVRRFQDGCASLDALPLHLGSVQDAGDRCQADS